MYNANIFWVIVLVPKIPKDKRLMSPYDGKQRVHLQKWIIYFIYSFSFVIFFCAIQGISVKLVLNVFLKIKFKLSFNESETVSINQLKTH